MGASCRIHASAPVCRLGSGVQNAVATGSSALAAAYLFAIHIIDNQTESVAPQVNQEVAYALPVLDVNTSLAGSSLSPIVSG